MDEDKQKEIEGMIDELQQKISNVLKETNDLRKYQEMCKLTAKKFETPEKEIMTWGLGIAGEAGDVASCIKKC